MSLQEYRGISTMSLTKKKFSKYTTKGRFQWDEKSIADQCGLLVDMVEQNLLTKEEAVANIDVGRIIQFQFPSMQPFQELDELGKGIGVSPGCVVGRIAFIGEDIKEFERLNHPCILVKNKISPEEFKVGNGIVSGILTTSGGRSSHAAIISRSYGKSCVICQKSQFKIENRVLRIILPEDRKKPEKSDDPECRLLRKGDWITLDGNMGRVFRGRMKIREPSICKAFHTLLEWEKEIRRNTSKQVQVFGNADDIDVLQRAKVFGAEGSFTRSERLLFRNDRIHHMRKLILNRNKKNSTKEDDQSLQKILEFHVSDFKMMFISLRNLPVTIRLLDPPLHEFLPSFETEEDVLEISRDLDLPPETVRSRIQKLQETNSMMGLRGCRVGIIFPEITEMQAKAIIISALEAYEETKKAIVVNVMVPFISSKEEFVHQKRIIEDCYRTYVENPSVLDMKIGALLETPRALILAADIVSEADFFSFGTNDLTQMVFGFSRDDSAVFIEEYITNGILEHSPFEVLDQEGVGKLMKWCVEECRKVKPDITIGICGEHGGEPSSIKFCVEELGLDYVSCSPNRIMTARIAACQGVLKQNIHR